MQRKIFGQAITGREGSNGRIVTVSLPSPHEGVGNALRSTFAPGREALPEDMAALLAKLDRH